MIVQTEYTPNPDTLKFLPGKKVSEIGPTEFSKKDKNIKIPPSDIDAFLKHQDVDEIKELCEQMYQDGEISYAGNGRYFVLTEESEKKEEKKTVKPKKTTAQKLDGVDVEKELEKYKGLLDKGLITQEDYDAKKKELLGL